MKTYSELIQFSNYADRVAYLQLNGAVGEDTFGFDRYLNQRFYRSKEWKSVRNEVILRDNACDLGLEDLPIPDGEPILIHHMNPVTKDDILSHSFDILNPEYLISVTRQTHNLIHYGFQNGATIPETLERMPGDTKLW